ncbi:hypothetical protein KCP78_23730 [Salmonella enterica subsp. enterica]|nr:hypothetical protein KCP78_23730 [Salmonella enterica subsp. enterica]
MAREVEKTRQRMEALSQKMREEQAQAMHLARRPRIRLPRFNVRLTVRKQASGPQEIQRIQQQIRDRLSRGIGSAGLSGADFEVTAFRVLTQAEEYTPQKVAFIRQLKEQATRQNL